MRSQVVEAIVRRVSGMFSEQRFRAWRPDVVISRSEKQWVVAVARQNLFQLKPLGFRLSVIRSFDGVPHTHHECRVFCGCLWPYLLIDAGLHVAGAIP